MENSRIAFVSLNKEDNTPEIVPLNWLDSNSELVCYPYIVSEIKKDKALKNKVDTLHHPHKLTSSYEILSEPQNNIKNVDDTSDSEEETRVKKRKRKVVIRSRKENKCKKKTYQNKKAKVEISTLPSCLLKNETCNRNFSSNVDVDTSRTQLPRQVCSLSDENCSVLLEIKATLSEINNRMCSLEEKVEDLLKSKSNIIPYQEDLELLKNLPLNSMSEFETFEEQLENKIFAEKFAKHISLIGGTGVKEVTLNSMRRVMTDKLAMQFSYCGRSRSTECPKKSFNGTIICDKIRFIILTTCSDATEVKIKEHMCHWLQQAKNRLTRREERNTTNGTSN